MEALQTLLLDGLFYITDEKLVTDHGEIVSNHLEPFVGHNVHIAIHFLPTTPDTNRWGGGCCMWQPHQCPAGHHVQSDRMLNVSASGVITVADGRWLVSQADGTKIEIPLLLLDGHYGRIIVATAFDHNMVDGESSDVVESIGLKVKDLSSLMEKLVKYTKDRQ